MLTVWSVFLFIAIVGYKNSVFRLHRTPEAKAFEKHFGPLEHGVAGRDWDERVQLALGNFKHVRDNAKIFFLYFRGAECAGREVVPSASGSSEPLSIVKTSDVASWSKDSLRDANPQHVHLVIGQTMFGPSVRQFAKPKYARFEQKSILVDFLFLS